jgi:hypothetical protein
LAQNSIGKQKLVRPGISVADFLKAYVSDQPYLQHKEWNNRGCEATLSIIYPVVAHTSDPYFANVPQDRLRVYRGGSIIYAGRQTKDFLADRKDCDHI